MGWRLSTCPVMHISGLAALYIVWDWAEHACIGNGLGMTSFQAPVTQFRTSRFNTRLRGRVCWCECVRELRTRPTRSRHRLNCSFALSADSSAAVWRKLAHCRILSLPTSSERGNPTRLVHCRSSDVIVNAIGWLECVLFGDHVWLAQPSCHFSVLWWLFGESEAVFKKSCVSICPS